MVGQAQIESMKKGPGDWPFFKFKNLIRGEGKMKEITRLRDLKSGVRDSIWLDPRIIIVEEGHNPRNFDLPENRASVEALKASIRVHGTLQPLLVRFEAATRQAVLVDGETRLRANLELIEEGVEIESVPTIQVQAANEADRLVIALTANTGKPLSQWETGMSFLKLRNFGWSDEKIAERMGQTVGYVKRAIDLSDAPIEVKEMLSRKALTPALAAQLVKEHGKDAGKVAKEKVEKAGGKQAKREKDKTALQKAVEALVEEVVDEMDGDEDFVSVSKAGLRRLMKAVGL